MIKDQGCHVCEGKPCNTSGYCLCHSIAQFGSYQSKIKPGRRWIPGPKRSKCQAESLVVSLIIHGVYDDCVEALTNAREIARKQKEIRTLDFYPLLLLSLKKFQGCYDLLKLRDTCAWIAGSMKNHCPFKNTVGAWTFEIDVVKHNNVQEDIGWLCKRSLSLSPMSSHLLHIVVPVMIVKLHSLRSLRREKGLHFWTILMGTHSRVGQFSPLRKIAGLTPVIRKIFDYSRNFYNPEIDSQMEKVRCQLQLLFSVCKLRRLVVEIAQIPEDVIGTSWKCKACKDGRHCNTDAGNHEEIFEELSWEKRLKHEHPLPFILLQKALKSVVSYSSLLAILNKKKIV